MPEKPNVEQERLMKLREKQISARDPMVKTRKKQHAFAERERRVGRSFSFGEMWTGLPNRWKGFYISLGLGLLALFIIIRLWDSPMALVVGGGVTLLFVIVGIITGNAFDVRDELNRLIK